MKLLLTFFEMWLRTWYVVQITTDEVKRWRRLAHTRAGEQGVDVAIETGNGPAAPVPVDLTAVGPPATVQGSPQRPPPRLRAAEPGRPPLPEPLPEPGQPGGEGRRQHFASIGNAPRSFDW